jgi:Na+/melibiose symporter-like transporter
MISVGVNSALLSYYNKYWLGNNDFTISKIFLGVMTLTILTTMLWTKLSRRVGKYRGFYVATIAYAIGMALFWFSKDGPLGFWLAVFVFGIANAGQQLFCFAIVPDVIAAERHRSGFAEEGAFTGIWVMGQKLGLAIGAGIAGLGLHFFGFAESLAGSFIEQTDSAMFAIVLFVSIVPGIICLLSLYPIYKSKQKFME